MKKTWYYKFEVSLSPQKFENKEISGAMIGSSKVKENRDIREKYGLNPRRGIGYKRVELNSMELEEALINGHVMCNLFHDGYKTTDGLEVSYLRKDGTFGSWAKRDCNFAGSYVVGVDIDETKYTSVKDFVDRLSLKPSIYYTSYSHMKQGKGVRFRMLYILDRKILYPLNFRYVAWLVNKMIEHDTGEQIHDTCNLRCSQYYNGTNIANKDVVVEHKNYGVVYSIEDFGYSHSGFMDFLKNNAFYKTKNTRRTKLIMKILNKFSNDFDEIIPDHDEYNFDDIEEPVEFDKGLVNCWSRNPRSVYPIFKDKYEFFDRPVEFGEGELYKKIDEDYFRLFFFNKKARRYYNGDLITGKLRDGERRRYNILQRMKLRKLMRPNITPDELLYNAMIDVLTFVENGDNTFNIERLKNMVCNVMEMDEEDISATEENEIRYLKDQSPKSGIIYKDKRSIKEAHYQMIDEYYKEGMTVKEMTEILKENNCPVSGDGVVRRYFAERGYSTKKSIDWVVLLEQDKSIRWNVENLKREGIRKSKDSVGTALKRLEKLQELRKQWMDEVERNKKIGVYNLDFTRSPIYKEFQEISESLYR